MTAPAFVALDSAGVVDARAVATMPLQVIDESEQFTNDERRPMATWTAQLGWYNSKPDLDACRAVVVSAVRWTLVGPIPVYIHGRVPAGVNVRFSYATDDGAVDVCAVSVQSGMAMTPDALSQYLTDTETWTATLADSASAYTSATLTGVKVRAGDNDIYIAVRSALGTATSSSTETILAATDAAGLVRLSPTGYNVAYAATVSTSAAVPTTWLAVRSIGGTILYRGTILHASYATTGASSASPIVMVEPSTGTILGSSIQWGPLSWISIVGISVDALGVFGDAAIDPRLRWYRSPGEQLLSLATRVRGALARRLPQIACGNPQLETLGAIHSGVRHWYQRSSVSSGKNIARWLYRHTQRFAATDSPFIEARVPVFWIDTGNDGADVFTLEIQDTAASTIDAETVTVQVVDSRTVTAAWQQFGISRYNAPSGSASTGTPFQQDGCVYAGEESTLWTWVTIRVDASGMSADTLYAIILNVNTGGALAGQVVTGWPGVRLGVGA